MVLIPLASRSVTGSGLSARSISLVFWKKCCIDTATPRATSGKKDWVVTVREGVTTMALVGRAGFLGNVFIVRSPSCLHRRGFGPAARHREPRGGARERGQVRPRPEEPGKEHDVEAHTQDEHQRLAQVGRHL